MQNNGNSNCAQNIPIFFIHDRWVDYLSLILEQARRVNQPGTVFFISPHPARAPSGVHGVQLNEYFEAARSFGTIYFHHSDQAPEYERFAIQRWFVLFEFMSRHNIEKAFLADTDVLLFCDIRAMQPRFAGYDYTLSAGHGAHSVFINRLEVLEDLCRYAVKLFSEPNHVVVNAIKQDWELLRHGLKKLVIPLDDMRLWDMFSDDLDLHVGDTRSIFQDSQFDHNISTAEGYKMQDGIKLLRWQAGTPFAFHNKLQRWIKMNSLHFQGATKSLIADNFERARLGHSDPLDVP